MWVFSPPIRWYVCQTVTVPNFPILQDCFFSKIWENMYTRYLYLRFPSLLLVFLILSVRIWHSFPAQWEDFSNKAHFSFRGPSKQVSTYCSDREWSDWTFRYSWLHNITFWKRRSSNLERCLQITVGQARSTFQYKVKIPVKWRSELNMDVFCKSEKSV